MKRIYLAGPEVFLDEGEALGEAKKALCQRYGFSGLFPTDKVVQQADSARELAMMISQGNEALIQQADIIVANLTPFRGPSADAGTIYELGMGRGANKLIAGYSNVVTPYLERVWAMYGEGELAQQQPGQIRDKNHHKIEEFGLMDNLMLEGGIAAAGGIFICRAVPESAQLTDLSAFEQVLAHLAERN